MLPCVEEPALRTLDADGDGVLSIHELRSSVPDNEQVQELVDALEAHGIAGIRYTGCGDTVDSAAEVASEGNTTSHEDIALIIARAAVSGLDGQGRG